jgi:hypothetical protein
MILSISMYMYMYSGINPDTIMTSSYTTVCQTLFNKAIEILQEEITYIQGLVVNIRTSSENIDSTTCDELQKIIESMKNHDSAAFTTNVCCHIEVGISGLSRVELKNPNAKRALPINPPDRNVKSRSSVSFGPITEEVKSSTSYPETQLLDEEETCNEAENDANAATTKNRVAEPLVEAGRLRRAKELAVLNFDIIKHGEAIQYNLFCNGSLKTVYRESTGAYKCSCDDFKKNGEKLLCKHIIFVSLKQQGGVASTKDTLIEESPILVH